MRGGGGGGAGVLGPTFSRGRGIQMLISKENHITCDFSGGVQTPLDSHMLFKIDFFKHSFRNTT